MPVELVVKGGVVVDGSGQPAFEADVAIAGGRIVEMGANLRGDRELDARGHVVAPGFIDIHTHYDAQVFWDGALTPSCFHGVTTVVAGNCGFSIAPVASGGRNAIVNTLENVEDMDPATLLDGVPWDFESFGDYLASVSRSGVALNFGAYIGHTALRLYVLGADYERPASEVERQKMVRLVEQAMFDGAMGVATSNSPTHLGIQGKPVASRFADLDEVTALIEVVRLSGRGLFGVVPGTELTPERLYELQRRVGVPFTYGALLATATGAHNRLLEVHRTGWENGAEVYPQVTPRPLTFSFTLAAPFPWSPNPVVGALQAADLAGRRRAYADPAWRQQVRDVWSSGSGGFMAPRWDTYEIVECLDDTLEGRSVVALAVERNADPLDLVLDLALDDPALGLRLRSVLANDDVAEVARLLNEPNTVLGLSDAGAHVGQLCDAPQATDLLANWVRERGVLSLEAAVHKLTLAQAELLGLTDRGRIAPGAFADVVVFDPDTVHPGPVRRVADFPGDSERLTADAPVGVRHVVVNGTPVRVDGEHDLAARPGVIVSPGPRPSRRSDSSI